MVLVVSAIPDSFLRTLLPGTGAPAALAAPPLWFMVAVGAVTALVVVLSYWPVRNLLGGRQLMNASFERYHLVNTYGAFGSVTASDTKCHRGNR